jgi:hypothetical protein|tara:strand:+ start:3671 stop:4120 length:450 start_codon:yes stop_codon:yes gene_type:complete
MAAVSSTYKDPSTSFVWWIEGDRIAIATEIGDGGTSETSETKLKPVQLGSGNTITDGMVISYYAEPDKLTSITGTLDIDNTLQPLLIDYVKYKALMDAASREDNPAIAQIRMASAQQCLSTYREGLRKFGMKKNEKTGGTRGIVPANMR